MICICNSSCVTSYSKSDEWESLEESPKRIRPFGSFNLAVKPTQWAKDDQTEHPGDPERRGGTKTFCLFPVVGWMIGQIVLKEVTGGDRE